MLLPSLLFPPSSTGIPICPLPFSEQISALKRYGFRRVSMSLRPTQANEHTEVGAPGLDFQTWERAASDSLLIYPFRPCREACDPPFHSLPKAGGPPFDVLPQLLQHWVSHPSPVLRRARTTNASPFSSLFLLFLNFPHHGQATRKPGRPSKSLRFAVNSA